SRLMLFGRTTTEGTTNRVGGEINSFSVLNTLAFGKPRRIFQVGRIRKTVRSCTRWRSTTDTSFWKSESLVDEVLLSKCEERSPARVMIRHSTTELILIQVLWGGVCPRSNERELPNTVSSTMGTSDNLEATCP